MSHHDVEYPRSPAGFSSQVRSWFEELLQVENYPFTLSTEVSSEITFYLGEEPSQVFCLLKFSDPSIPVDYPSLLVDSAEAARRLKAPYFLTWNIRDTVLWETPKRGTPVSREHRRKTYFTIHQVAQGADLILDAYLKPLLKQRAKEILDDLAALHRDGHLHLVDVDATFFVNRLRQAVETLWPPIKRSLMTTVERDPSFKSELSAWAVLQGIARFDDESFYETVARQIVYRVLGKIIFYQSLRRAAKDLLEIDLTGLNLALVPGRLREYFEKARKIDYQAVFEEDISERVPFPQPALEELVKLVGDLNQRDFSHMPQDVVGQVFEQLIPQEERHSLGQYFTREDLVDLINAFCVRSSKDRVLDPTCGSGTFLIRAYDRLNILGEKDHGKLLSQLWGIDIAHFPAQLATMNLWRQNLAIWANFPRIISMDFFSVKSGQAFRFPPPRVTGDSIEWIEESLPVFDAAVGNFPYIRQEIIERRVKGYKRTLEKVLAEDWLVEYQDVFELKKHVLREFENAKKENLGLSDYYDKAQLKLSGQADIYAYLFFHTARFIREDGGRMGIVTSNAWLDVAYGYELQRFFLKNFKIIAILESRCEPWFEDVAVNTIVTILERCPNKKERDDHLVKFAKVKKKLKDLIPWDMKLDAVNRWRGIEALTQRIERTGSENYQLVGDEWVCTLTDLKTYEDEDFRIRVKRQGELLEEVEKAGKTVKWGQCLRAPDVYSEILEKCGDKLVPLREVAEIRRGYTTGINEFFYLTEEKAREWGIEEEFLKPVLKSSKEFEGILIDPSKLRLRVFLCSESKERLRQEGKTGALRYIESGEGQKTRDGVPWPEVPTVKGRKPGWWALPEAEPTQIFWSKAYDVKLLHRYCETPIIADCRIYFLSANEGIDNKLLAAMLNSSVSMLFLELIGRVSLGEGALDLMVEDAREYMIIPYLSSLSEVVDNISGAFDQLLTRPIKPVFEEVKMKDRQRLDSLVLQALGLDPEKYLQRIYNGLTELVRERIELGKMRTKAKKAKVERDIDKVKKQVLEELLPEGPKRFPEDFLDLPAKRGSFKEINISAEPLRLGKYFFGTQEVVSEGGFCYKAKSPTEGKFIIYAQRPGCSTVSVPTDPMSLFKMVKSYEIYLRELKKTLFKELFNRTLDQKTADNLTQTIFQEQGLPEVEEA